MKRLVVLVLVALGGVAAAQPVPPPGLRQVQHNAELSGTGSGGDKLRLTPCGTGQGYQWNGSSWACASTGGGVSGTGTTGNLSVFSASTALGDFAGSSPAPCAAGNVVTRATLGTTGALSLTCSSITGLGAATGTGATGQLAKWSSSTGLAAAWPGDDGTTWGVANKFTIDESTGLATMFGGAAWSVGTSAQTSGTINTLSPGGNSVYRITSSGNLSINGIDHTGRVNGSILCLYNDSGWSLVFNHENAGALAADRLNIPGTTALTIQGVQSGPAVCMLYSTDASRWKVLWWGGLRWPSMQLDSGLTVSAGGAVISGNSYFTGSSVTPSSCGTSPTVTGHNNAGIVTIGTGTVTACTVTFNSGGFTTTPACQVREEFSQAGPGGNLYFSAKSPTGFTVTSTGTNAAGLTFDYWCAGI